MSSTHFKLRKLFADFWQKKHHKEVSPISLVPKDDPTTLFTSSGMQPLIPYLMGEPHPLGKKLYNIQPCFRSQDIEFVGDNRHTTFFEMMGNWSLGDYFKEEQLEWCLEFFTKEIALPKEKLFVTVFEGTKEVPRDEESAMIWKKLGLPAERIFYCGAEKNWWSRSGTPEQMPAGEIGGPDSEVFYDFGISHNPSFSKTCHPNCECGRFLEIGNSVFIQYKKKKDGTLEQLPQKNVDFGGGLERILAALSNNPDVFKIDLLWPIIERIQEASGRNYQDNEKSMRIVADHLRAAVFLIIAGVTPYKQEQGSILRKLIRNSIDAIRDLGIEHSIISHIAEVVVKIYKDCYADVDKYSGRIMQELSQEEENYFNIIVSEEKNLKKILLGKGLHTSGTISNNGKRIIDGKLLFDLKQSRGISLPTISRFLKKSNIFNDYILDIEGYKMELEKHREISRKGAFKKFKGGLIDQSKQTIKYHTSTHLLHQALKDVFGNEVRQEGSNITAERLRFDFQLSKKPTDEEIKKIENIVNQKIKESLPVYFKIMPQDEAVKIGALAFFREKYSDQVKVYFIGGSTSSPQVTYSKEFCAGPHVKNTSEIGSFKIIKVKKIGANLMRIYGK